MSVHILFLAAGIGISWDCPVQEGVFIRAVEMEGLRHTRPHVVQQELSHRTGGTFSCEAWVQEHFRLKDLGVFASINLEASSKHDSANLRYRFRELPPYLPMLTVNKTDQDGLSLGPHVAALNLLGTAKKAHVLARFLGTTEYQVLISGRQFFGWPVEFDAAWFHINSHNPFDNFHENSHRVKSEFAWPRNRTFGLVGMAEWFWIRSDTAGITLRPEGDAVPRIGLGLRMDSRDRVMLPRRGYFAETRITQNGGLLGGPADFREWLADVRGYLPVSPRQTLIANALYQVRGRGAMGAYDDFHVGGANTLRGYPVNARQARNEILLNGEYRFDAVRERVQSLSALGPWSMQYALQLVAGVDGAGLWEHSGLIGRDFATGIYGGIHLLVPGVNRVRLEVGAEAGETKWRADFGLFEKTSAQRLRIR